MAPASVAGSEGSLASLARDCIRHGGHGGRGEHAGGKDLPRGHRNSKDIRHLRSQAFGDTVKNDGRDRRWECEAGNISARHLGLRAGDTQRQAISENRSNPRRHQDPRTCSFVGASTVDHMVHPSFQTANDGGHVRQHAQRKVLLSSQAPPSVNEPDGPAEALWRRRERTKVVETKPRMTQPIHHGVSRSSGYGNRRANSEPQVTDHRTVAQGQLPRESSRERGWHHEVADTGDPVELRGSSRHQELLKSSNENVLAQPSTLWESHSPRRAYAAGPAKFAPPPRVAQARPPPSSRSGSVLSDENLRVHERSQSGSSRSSRAGSAFSRSSCSSRSQSSHASSRVSTRHGASRRSQSLRSANSPLQGSYWTQLMKEAEVRGRASTSMLSNVFSAGVLPSLDHSRTEEFLFGEKGRLVSKGIFSPQHNTGEAVFPA